MSGKRISELPALSGAGSANDDFVLIFDTSTSTTKRILRSQLAEGMVPDLPFLYFHGVRTSDPTQRLNGDALQLGDGYLRSSDMIFRYYTNSGWSNYEQISIAAAQAWAEGTQPGGVGTKSAKEWATTAQNWAESATAPGGVGTKSAKTWATEAITSAVSAAGSATTAGISRDNAVAAAEASGPVSFYDTKAAATTDLANIPSNGLVEVAVDESQASARTRYRKESGALVFKFRIPKDIGNAAGVGAAARRVRGTLVHIGDSNTNGRPGWRLGYTYEWLASGGIFEGWTSYNLGQNGSTLDNWANTEVANVDNPAYANLPPADYNATDPGAGALARAINANPDIIVLSLGTNDENNPSSRAGIGTEVNLRSNLAKLVNFLLQRTKAGILLRMPQPFAFENFLGITQWVDAAEAAEASRRLRQVYSEWIGVHPRVEVYHSHQALFGNSCDNKAVNAQDPYGFGALIEDSLHPTDLGYRRITQQIAMQLNPAYPRTPVRTVIPFTIPKVAKWAVTLYVRGYVTSGTSATVDVDISPLNAIAGSGAEAYWQQQSKSRPITDKWRLEDLGKTPAVSAYQELMAVPRKNKVYAYSWTNGTTTLLTGYTFAQFITANEPHYAQLTFTSAAFDKFGNGPVTFYVQDDNAVPYAQTYITNTTMTANSKRFGVPLLGATIGGGAAYRVVNGNAVTVTVYLFNQADGRYVLPPETFNAPGKPVGTFSWSAWGNTRAAFVFDPTNYPDGSIVISGANTGLRAEVTTGTFADLGASCDLYFTT